MLVITVEVKDLWADKVRMLVPQIGTKPIYFVNTDFGTVDTSEILDNTQSPHSTESELSIDMLYAGECN